MSRLAIFFLMVLAPVLAILLGWFLLVLGVAYPVGGVIYYFIRREPFWKSAGGGEAARDEKGDRSFWLILPGFLAVFFASPLEFMYLHLLPHAFWLEMTGLAILLFSLALRIWARAHIRGLYSGHVEVKAEHQLVQSGPYRFVRHPGYSGLVLMA